MIAAGLCQCLSNSLSVFFVRSCFGASPEIVQELRQREFGMKNEGAILAERLQAYIQGYSKFLFGGGKLLCSAMNLRSNIVGRGGFGTARRKCALRFNSLRFGQIYVRLPEVSFGQVDLRQAIQQPNFTRKLEVRILLDHLQRPAIGVRGILLAPDSGDVGAVREQANLAARTYRGSPFLSLGHNSRARFASLSASSYLPVAA